MQKHVKEVNQKTDQKIFYMTFRFIASLTFKIIFPHKTDSTSIDCETIEQNLKTEVLRSYKLQLHIIIIHLFSNATK